MFLLEYLSKKRISHTQLAKKIGCHHATITRVLSLKNKTRLSYRLSEKIERETNGLVTVKEARMLQSEIQEHEAKQHQKENDYPILNLIQNKEKEEMPMDLMSALKRWTDIEIERRLIEVQIKEIREKQEQIERDHGFNFNQCAG